MRNLIALTITLLLSQVTLAKLIQCKGPVDGSFKYETCGPDHYCRLLASCKDDERGKELPFSIFVCKAITVSGQKACPETQACVEESQKIASEATFIKTDEFPRR